MAEQTTQATEKRGWGGKRAGAGRKPGPNAGKAKVTTVVLTSELIDKLHDLGGSKWIREQILNCHPSSKSVELSGSGIFESVPNPTSESHLFIDLSANVHSLDISELLVQNPEKTFFCTVRDDSLNKAGIEKGDILIVEKNENPVSGSVVLVDAGNSLTLRRLIRENGGQTLCRETEGDENASPDNVSDAILGVVVYSIKNLKAKRNS